MFQLESANSYLRELADLVQTKTDHPGDKPGLVITSKVLKVLAELSRRRTEYFADKLELAKMEGDARQIQVTILAGAEDAEALGNSNLWGEEERKEELPEKLRQGLAAMVNLFTVPTFSTFSPFYHRDLLDKGIAALEEKENRSATVQQCVRKCAETLLKEAFAEDSQPHYLLRDPSSQSPVRGSDSFTLSFINRDGTIDHKLLVYYEELRLWGQNNSDIGYRDLSNLIETIVPGALGIRKAEARVRVDSNSYEL